RTTFTPATRGASRVPAAMNGRGLLLLLAAAVGSAAAAPVAASAEAGASSFEGARRLYRRPHASTLPVFVPPVRLDEPPPPAEPGAEPSEPRFAIERFDVVGNTLLSPSEVDGALAPFVGADKRLADVEAARNALQKAYDAAGFLTVAVVLPQ